MKKALLSFLLLVLVGLSTAFVSAADGIVWTDEEEAFIAAHPIVTLGVDPGFVPFEFIEDGEYLGIASDYVAIIEEKTGIDFQVVPDLTWSEAYFEALAGHIDILPAVSKTPAREAFFLFSDMYYEVKRVIVTLNDNTSIRGIEDLFGMTVAVQTNSSHHSFLLEYPEINLSLYDTVQDALSAVSDGSEVAFVGNLATSDYMIKSMALTNLRFTALATDDPIGLHFAVRTDWPELVTILNKSLSSITAEERIEINARWVTVATETDYGPLIRTALIIGGVGLIVTLVSAYWILKLKKEIANRKRIQADLEVAKREAEEANGVKSSFMARMSHEIRTPLNAITGMSYLLKKTEITRTQRMYADRITQASTTMLSIINDILDYAKIEAGKVELEIRPFSLDQAVQNLISIMSVKIEEKGLGFRLTKDPAIPSWFKGDQKRIEQILLNLLNNAVKFTDRGEIALEIRLVAREGDRHHLAIAVVDTGIGMSEKAIDGLFVPFAQADASINRRFGGTGLGLSIVKNLVEMMGGTIKVYSTEGQGSSFVVSLSLDCDREREEEDRKDGSSLYLRNLRTLVLERTASTMNIMDSYLSAFGLSSELTTSPAAATSLLENTGSLSAKPFDLFILDYETPAELGFDFVAKLRQNPRIPNLPKIVMLLPMQRTDLFDKLDEHGIDIGVGKPIIPSVLHNAVIEIFAHRAVADSEAYEENAPLALDLEHRTIMIVDDNATNQMIARLLLEQAGFATVSAGDGKEAVELFEKEAGKVALVLMDLHMPVMNGYAAADAIRRLDPAVPIVAMTAEVVAGVKEKCAQHGMLHSISKPFEPERFADSVRAILRGSAPAKTEEPTAIDRRLGLRSIGGDAALYEAILAAFRGENEKTASDLAKAVAAKDYPAARQIAHKIKGSSGSIGAKAVHDAAVALMKAIDGNDAEAIARETAAFVAALRTTLREIGADVADGAAS
ncbi:MAG: transporter substrate-binding domain-containing protein [Candidatus Izemoplasmatales bacterium]